MMNREERVQKSARLISLLSHCISEILDYPQHWPGNAMIEPERVAHAQATAEQYLDVLLGDLEHNLELTISRIATAQRTYTLYGEDRGEVSIINDHPPSTYT